MNTRSTFAGTGTARPAPSVTVSARAARGATSVADSAAGTAASSARRLKSINPPPP